MQKFLRKDIFHSFEFAVIGLVVFFVLIFFTLPSFAANVEFTSYTELELEGVPAEELYATPSSTCDLLEIDTSTLTVSGIGVYFGLKTDKHDQALFISPATSSVDLVFDSGNYSSGNITEWTLTATGSGEFDITVGTPKANTYYELKVDGVIEDTYTSDSSAKISFTYSGDLSAGKVFTISADSVSPDSFSLVSPEEGASISDRTPEFSWEASFDTNFDHYELFVADEQFGGDITGTSYTPSESISCGDIEWYVKAFDEIGNNTRSNVHSLQVNCGGGLSVDAINSNQTESTDSSDDEQTGEEEKDGDDPSGDGSDDTHTGEDDLNTSISGDDEETDEGYEEKADKLISGQSDDVLQEIGETRDENREKEVEDKYLKDILDEEGGDDDGSSVLGDHIKIFATYGVDENTKELGVEERVELIRSYKKAFKKLPDSKEELADLIKISEGRFPGEVSKEAEAEAMDPFIEIYRRIPDMENIRDKAAIVIMVYGLRQKKDDRKPEKEARAKEIFNAIFGHYPENTDEKNIMQAIAYSGAKREVDTDGDLICDIHEEGIGTDPANPDTNKNGREDGRDVLNGEIPYPDGSLVSEVSSSAVYLIEGQKKRPIFNGKIFEDRGFAWGDVIQTASLAHYPNGDLIK